MSMTLHSILKRKDGILYQHDELRSKSLSNLKLAIFVGRISEAHPASLITLPDALRLSGPRFGLRSDQGL